MKVLSLVFPYYVLYSPILWVPTVVCLFVHLEACLSLKDIIHTSQPTYLWGDATYLLRELLKVHKQKKKSKCLPIWQLWFHDPALGWIVRLKKSWKGFEPLLNPILIDWNYLLLFIQIETKTTFWSIVPGFTWRALLLSSCVPIWFNFIKQLEISSFISQLCSLISFTRISMLLLFRI